MAISGRHLQLVQTVVKMVRTDCVCSGAQRAPKAVTGIAVAIQRRETSRFVIARPRRGRGNLLQQPANLPGFSCYLAGYYEAITK